MLNMYYLGEGSNQQEREKNKNILVSKFKKKLKNYRLKDWSLQTKIFETRNSGLF